MDNVFEAKDQLILTVQNLTEKVKELKQKLNVSETENSTLRQRIVELEGQWGDLAVKNTDMENSLKLTEEQKSQIEALLKESNELLNT